MTFHYSGPILLWFDLKNRSAFRCFYQFSSASDQFQFKVERVWSRFIHVTSNCQIYTLFYKNVVLPAQATEYSYFSADFRLKIFLYNS